MYKRHRRPAPHWGRTHLLPLIQVLLMLFLGLTADGWVELIL